MNFTDVTFSGNNASGNNGMGGAVFMVNTSQNLNSVSVVSNMATNTGNGIYSIGSTVTGAYIGGDSQVFIP